MYGYIGSTQACGCPLDRHEGDLPSRCRFCEKPTVHCGTTPIWRLPRARPDSGQRLVAGRAPTCRRRPAARMHSTMLCRNRFFARALRARYHRQRSSGKADALDRDPQVGNRCRMSGRSRRPGVRRCPRSRARCRCSPPLRDPTARAKPTFCPRMVPVPAVAEMGRGLRRRSRATDGTSIRPGSSGGVAGRGGNLSAVVHRLSSVRNAKRVVQQMRVTSFFPRHNMPTKWHGNCLCDTAIDGWQRAAVAFRASSNILPAAKTKAVLRKRVDKSSAHTGEAE